MRLFLALSLLAAPCSAQWQTGDYTSGKSVSVFPGGVDLSTITTALLAKAASGANGDITSLSALKTISNPFTGTSSATFRAGAVSPNTYVVGVSSNNGTLMIGVKHNGLTTLGNRSIAQLKLDVPALGDSAYCSDCSPKKLVVGTGTSAGNWADAAGGAFK